MLGVGHHVFNKYDPRIVACREETQHLADPGGSLRKLTSCEEEKSVLQTITSLDASHSCCFNVLQVD